MRPSAVRWAHGSLLYHGYLSSDVRWLDQRRPVENGR
jgi:hypothetical protein